MQKTACIDHFYLQGVYNSIKRDVVKDQNAVINDQLIKDDVNVTGICLGSSENELDATRTREVISDVEFLSDSEVCDISLDCTFDESVDGNEDSTFPSEGADEIQSATEVSAHRKSSVQNIEEIPSVSAGNNSSFDVQQVRYMLVNIFLTYERIWE